MNWLIHFLGGVTHEEYMNLQEALRLATLDAISANEKYRALREKVLRLQEKVCKN